MTISPNPTEPMTKREFEERIIPPTITEDDVQAAYERGLNHAKVAIDQSYREAYERERSGLHERLLDDGFGDAEVACVRAAFAAGWTSRNRTAQETADRLVEAERALGLIECEGYEPVVTDVGESWSAGAAKIARAYFASHPQNQGKETP